jgi:hypothetical protein
VSFPQAPSQQKAPATQSASTMHGEPSPAGGEPPVPVLDDEAPVVAPPVELPVLDDEAPVVAPPVELSLPLPPVDVPVPPVPPGGPSKDSTTWDEQFATASSIPAAARPEAPRPMDP